MTEVEHCNCGRRAERIDRIGFRAFFGRKWKMTDIRGAGPAGHGTPESKPDVA